MTPAVELEPFFRIDSFEKKKGVEDGNYSAGKVIDVSPPNRDNSFENVSISQTKPLKKQDVVKKVVVSNIFMFTPGEDFQFD